MALPLDFIILRHGQSEANTKQQDPRGNMPNDGRDNFAGLTQRGIEQAKAAAAWLRWNGLTTFDRYYTSPYRRARQTATLLALDGRWTIDARWRERDCGGLPQGVNGPQPHKWYWRPDGGESLAIEVRQRFESILATVRHEASDRRVIATTHGKFMTVVRFVLERMTTEEWFEKDQQELIDNCQILHYSRRSPTTGIVDSEMRWLRSVCPWDSSRSWHDGQWIELCQHPREANAVVTKHPPGNIPRGPLVPTKRSA